jgi:hypothetical protein
MTDLRAYCGLDCSVCDAYNAHQFDDQARREATAKKWSEMYKADIKPEDINCTGCKSESEVKFRHCSECAVRSCATGRGLGNCGRCEEYPCERIKPIIEAVPDAKAFLEGL